jgi:hypothetical protein
VPVSLSVNCITSETERSPTVMVRRLAMTVPSGVVIGLPPSSNLMPFRAAPRKAFVSR